jgi:hypothetical protein
MLDEISLTTLIHAEFARRWIQSRRVIREHCDEPGGGFLSRKMRIIGCLTNEKIVNYFVDI